ncbi:hypothetical protein [Variovorax gossypii]
MEHFALGEQEKELSLCRSERKTRCGRATQLFHGEGLAKKKCSTHLVEQTASAGSRTEDRYGAGACVPKVRSRMNSCSTREIYVPRSVALRNKKRTDGWYQGRLLSVFERDQKGGLEHVG